MSLENITPYKNSSQEKKLQIARMFNNIAWRYDFLNHFLSLGIDSYWRKKTIAQLKTKKPLLILDIATGTGDLAIEAMKLKPAKIFGVDISIDMLELGRKKIKRKNLEDKIELLEGDSEQLFFDDNKFDAVTVAYGVRNFEHLERGLSEMYRVLNANGKIVVLEFSRPRLFPFRQLFNFYFKNILPTIGKLTSKDARAYSYLYESVQAFPDGDDFLTVLNKVGFKNTSCTSLTLGICSLYVGYKK